MDLVSWGRDCFTSASELFSQTMDAIEELEIDRAKPEHIKIYWNAVSA